MMEAQFLQSKYPPATPAKIMKYFCDDTKLRLAQQKREVHVVLTYPGQCNLSYIYIWHK